VRRIIEAGIDLNARIDVGASLLFGAILYGDEEIIRMMLEHGADPNFFADEPAATIYTEKRLDLALQARFLLDWDRYDPIVKLLESFGATDYEGQVESESDRERCQARAREYQAKR
jgi:ankyrin repeat protein